MVDLAGRSTCRESGQHYDRTGIPDRSVTQRPARRRGLTINRQFTAGGLDPYASVSWSKRTSRITNPDGSVVFEMADAEIPATWSQVAADIMVSKYFRKAGVPQYDDDGKPLRDEDGDAEDRPGAIRPAGHPPPGRLLALLGREVRLFRLAPRTPRPSTTSWPTCWSTRWPRPTRRSGSTPASTTPTASPAPPRATTTSIHDTGEVCAQRRRLHPPAAARVLHPVGR